MVFLLMQRIDAKCMTMQKCIMRSTNSTLVQAVQLQQVYYEMI